jgi:predicted dehydrogenase
MHDQNASAGMPSGQREPTRREFLGTAAATAVTLAMAAPPLAGGAETDRKLRLGLIGCGGRGAWIGELFRRHGGYQIVGAADYFKDRVDAFGQTFGVPPERRFTGLSGYLRLLECDLDAVAIITPPCFHPEQAAAAVERGRHVYLAKPVAVDVPGCQRIAASAKAATASKLVFLVDFQTRAQPFYQEAVKRVHEGAIGGIAFGEARYHAEALGIQAPPGTAEARLRNWAFDIALSGDIITEQNIHAIDVMNWVLGVPPVQAAGSGGRKVRTNVGDCWDHFALVFQYPDNVGVIFSSKQYRDGGRDVGIAVDIFGAKGRLQTVYGGRVMIAGENSYAGGPTSNIYEEGAVNNIAEFHRCIGQGLVDNPTVAPSVQSNLITIMGRTAAYENRVVTWAETLRSTAMLDPRLDGLKG